MNLKKMPYLTDIIGYMMVISAVIICLDYNTLHVPYPPEWVIYFNLILIIPLTFLYCMFSATFKNGFYEFGSFSLNTLGYIKEILCCIAVVIGIFVGMLVNLEIFVGIARFSIQPNIINSIPEEIKNIIGILFELITGTFFYFLLPTKIGGCLAFRWKMQDWKNLSAQEGE